MNAIWNSWLPQSGYVATDAPGLERYDERFNPETGLGGFEIWILVRKQKRFDPSLFGKDHSQGSVPVSPMAIHG